MAERRLTPDEAALWRRVMATVRPARPAPAKPSTASPVVPTGTSAGPGSGSVKVPAKLPAPPRARPAEAALLKPQPKPKPGTTLDASWDRKLATGNAAPDSVIDLHGHTLQSAYGALDAGLDRAIVRGDRILLLITGKPPRPESERPHARGRIREAVGDWLAASRHAANIASVRPAHPRHGGAGALYIVLRRSRNERKY